MRGSAKVRNDFVADLHDTVKGVAVLRPLLQLLIETAISVSIGPLTKDQSAPTVAGHSASRADWVLRPLLQLLIETAIDRSYNC